MHVQPASRRYLVEYGLTDAHRIGIALASQHDDGNGACGDDDGNLLTLIRGQGMAALVSEWLRK